MSWSLVIARKLDTMLFLFGEKWFI